MKRTVKNFYELIKRIKRSKSENGPLLNEEGCFIFDTQSKLELLLKTYLDKQCVNSDQKLANEIWSVVNVRYEPEQNGHKDGGYKARTNFLVSEVLEAIKSFKNRTAPGPSGTTSMILKRFSQYLAPPLTDIFNKALEEYTPLKYQTLLKTIPKGT